MRVLLVAALAVTVNPACGGSDSPSTRASHAAVPAADSLAKLTPSGPTLVTAPPCAADNGGLTLPDGFCAVVVANRLGPVRHLAVAPNGDVFVALQQGDGVLALRDTSGDGAADVIKRFGIGGGTGLALRDGWLYMATNQSVVRWPWKPGQLEPVGAPETIVRSLPSTGDHGAKSIALGPADELFVNVGSATNSCQENNRRPRSPGEDPCVELETRAGVWLFSASTSGQRQQDGKRFATGLRNTIALAVRPGSASLYGAVHGRDQLSQNWGFSDRENAENPGEEFVQIAGGDDFGWPYCYWSTTNRKLVVAPEYGGDGKEIGRCVRAKEPLVAFPGHWAPLAIAFYEGDAFGPAYKGGAFIAFHGSWNREPLPQAGYRVVFQPFVNGRPTDAYTTFATGTAGPTSLRPSGLAVGADGSLYISSDGTGTVWRVMKKK